MAKCPNWFDCKFIGVKDNNIQAEIKINYIPLRLFIPKIIKIIGWRIWLYPKVWNWCLDEMGLIIK